VVSQVLFYASPVIIPIETVQQKLSPTLVHLYMLNPIATALQQFRHAMINHATPSVGQIFAHQVAVLAPIGIAVGILVLGFVVFNRTAPHVAEDL
jgi:ABC-2 type transport system permease protein